MANNVTQTSDKVNVQTREETRSTDKYIRPAVNIIENDEGLVLMADMPGTTKESLDVNVEKGILTISATTRREFPGTPVYREFELANYYRQFSIPETLDHSKLRAEYNNGILTLRVPKAEIAKPRKIEVKVI